MIEKVILLSSAEQSTFCRVVNQGIKNLQEEGLQVEIQYKPVMEHDEYNYVLYTAMLIGRLRNEK